MRTLFPSMLLDLHIELSQLSLLKIKANFFFFFFGYYSECTTTNIHKENEDNVRRIYFLSLTTKMKHERSTNNYRPRACLMLNLNSSCVIMMENVKTITDFLFLFF